MATPSSFASTIAAAAAARFEILGELGRGGMGVVYRARERESKRLVALKVVLEPQANPERVARFTREGQVAASLKHPGIVRVHAAGHLDGRPFLAFELIEGCRSLREALEARTLPLAGRVELVRQAAEALGYAHAAGVVHRDVKPDNVLVDAAGRARVADFGLAATQDVERLTRTGALLGTPAYMAPEQLQGEKGPSVDVWALGVVLYEALTGTHPFPAQNMLEMAGKIAHRDPLAPRRHDPTLPREVEAVCLKALAKTPAERYPTGAELAEDLRAFLAGGAVGAGPPGAVGRLLRRRGWLAVAPVAATIGAALLLLVDPAGPPPSAASPGPAVAPSAPAPPTASATAAPSPGLEPEPEPEPEPLDPMEAGIRELARVVTENDPNEVTAYRLLAEAGEVNAMLAYAECLREGKDGAERDPVAAVRWFERAAAAGSAQAAHELGLTLAECPEVRDDERAAACFREAAEAGHPAARECLAQCLLTGRGVERDPEAAVAWLRRAAQSERPSAMLKLAELLLAGEVLPRDEAEATALLERAAALGHEKSRLLLRRRRR